MALIGQSMAVKQPIHHKTPRDGNFAAGGRQVDRPNPSSKHGGQLVAGGPQIERPNPSKKGEGAICGRRAAS